ncbi:MAG: PucR family transcriptional regulator ligand-binding domain-containing protein [Lachnospiraceae bacterium]|nr:PucR family transcriptional regulator ligand-binding domain-containing protein [Lachnospiraceae bacterium]
MSILLREVYEETKTKYGLQLIAGEGGLSAIMNWVYISESVVGPGYLSGGELIITTGVLCRESPEWLYHFIEAMIEEHTCGMILNLGRYLWPAHITAEILELCSRSNYPLFTMPWETQITHVTRDYYNRIFHDSQREEALSAAFLNLVHGRTDKAASLSLLEEYGLPAQTACCAVYVSYSLAAEEEQEQRRTEARLRLALSHQIQTQGIPAYLCSAAEYFLIVLPLSDKTARDLPWAPRLHAFTDMLAKLLSERFPSAAIAAGCGTIQPSLDGLPKSFFHARSAAAFAAAGTGTGGRPGASFDELGFYRILLSVSDRDILRSYADSLLEPAEIYEKKHQGSYLATLEEYLLCGGSIQAIAQHLYCHRNTINKRVRILREELSYDLDDPRTRFELSTAFAIRSFLRLFP